MMECKSFIGAHDEHWEDDGLRSHQELEITLIMEGSGRFCAHGREARVESGNVVLIPSEVPHSFHALSPIRFGVLLADRIPSEVKELFDRLIQDGRTRIIALSRLDRDRYERLFREWLRIRSAPLKDPIRNYAVWVELLLLFLNEHAHSDHQALSISFIGDYIRQHIQDPVHVSALAEMAGLSEDGFRKQFAKIYGMTPKQYQQQCRLAEAKWLLSSSDKDLQSLAESVGFSQLHSFSLWFKKMEGCPPSEWRNRQRLYHH